MGLAFALFLFVIVAWTLLAARSFRRSIDADLARVLASSEAEPRDAVLPEALAAFVARVGLPATGAHKWFKTTQVGEMRFAEGGRWFGYHAVQAYSVARAEFVWRAELWVFPLVRIVVVDALVGGRGRLEARLFGAFPIARASGEAVERGQRSRYLAELPWCPRAFELGEARFEPRATPDRITARAGEGPQRVELRYELDALGDVVRVRGLRPRVVGGSALETSWVGEFFDYGVVSGLRVPQRARARWETGRGPFVYWQGTVTSVEWR